MTENKEPLETAHMGEGLAVTQADRDRAADFGGWDGFRTGNFDGHKLVQTLAAHRLAATPTALPSAEDAARIIREQMREWWDEICSDTGCHPLDIRREGRKLFYEDRHWTAAVAQFSAERIIALQSPRASDEVLGEARGAEPVGALLICDATGGRIFTAWPVPGHKLREAESLYRKQGGYRTVPLYALSASPVPVDASGVERFWLIVHEPGCVPERKGPWLMTGFKPVLRDFINARPTAYLTVLTVGDDGVPHVQHGPEALQMADGRSMSVGRKHNARTLAAHTAPVADAQAGEGK